MEALEEHGSAVVQRTPEASPASDHYSRQPIAIQTL